MGAQSQGCHQVLDELETHLANREVVADDLGEKIRMEFPHLFENVWLQQVE